MQLKYRITMSDCSAWLFSLNNIQSQPQDIKQNNVPDMIVDCQLGHFVRLVKCGKKKSWIHVHDFFCFGFYFITLTVLSAALII